MQLFVSYAHQSIEVVRQTAEVLTMSGHVVWFDTELLPGQDWKRALGDEIARCDAFALVMTAEALASEWCQWELATAISLDKAVIPVLLESNIAIPDPLRRLQFADFTHGVTPIAVAKLMGALSKMQKIAPSESPGIPVDPKGTPARAWKNANHWSDTFVTPAHTPQNEAEEVIEKFVGTQRRGVFGVEGRIILTNQRVLFEARKFNFPGRKEPESISLSEIETIKPMKSLGLLPYGIEIRCRSGKKFLFVTWYFKRIIAIVEEYRGRVRGRH